MSVFGDNLGAIVKTRWRNQTEAAKYLGLHQTLLGRYLRAESEPLLSHAVRIAKKLDVPLDELTGMKYDQAIVGGMFLKEEKARYSGDAPARKAMEGLRERWRKHPQERRTIEHLVAALFPDDTKALIAWLKGQ
jgi:transcriptional regulator with XRE-family HTH domain